VYVYAPGTGSGAVGQEWWQPVVGSIMDKAGGLSSQPTVTLTTSGTLPLTSFNSTTISVLGARPAGTTSECEFSAPFILQIVRHNFVEKARTPIAFITHTKIKTEFCASSRDHNTQYGNQPTKRERWANTSEAPGKFF